MQLVRLLIPLVLALPSVAATFGTVVPSSGGASYSDILLDQARQRLYLVNSSANRVDVYSIQQRAYLAPIRTDTQPVSVALSANNNILYITAYTASVLDVVDLTKATLTVTTKIALPAGPEGVAVGGNGQVLISTIGNSGQNVLLVYDPAAPSGKNLNNVAVTPAAPTPPQLPAPSGTAYLSYHSKMITTTDGKFVIGGNVISGGGANNRVVFVYEVASATVLRSRIVTNLSNVLSVAPDGSKFMAGSTLFDTATLAILAQENVANSPFAFPANANFNTQQNQGGSVFSPDGSTVFAAFNFAPVQNPPARANVSRLLINDSENLLIKMGLQLPENLAGRIVLNAAGDTAYALSESGFITLPLSTISNSPLAQLDSQVVLLANDQCGVTAPLNQVTNNIQNAGKGRLTANVQAYTVPNSGVNGLGGFGGPGGGFIFLPGGGLIFVGGGGGGTTTSTVTGTTPIVTTRPTATGASLTFRYNPSAARNLGTVTPNDFLVQSPEAINIPANIRVFQNNRDADARGSIVTVPLNISAGEGLMDMVMDTARQRIYIANSGMNEVEVLDMRTQTLMPPIKVGQLPHSIALSTDGVTMYVGNTGGESISIVDLGKMQTTGRVKFPPIPVNAAVALAFPAAMANSERGPQFVMSDGTLWKVDGNQAIPRLLNTAIFGGTNPSAIRIAAGNPAQRTMVGTPGGEYVLLVTGAGNAYLYDASVDDYTVGRQIFSTPITGFIGPVAAGPRGQYFIANGTVLNSSLTVVATPAQITGPTGGGGLPGRGGTTTTTSRPISAVAAVGANSFARFTQPVLQGNTATSTDAGQVEIDDAATGNPLRVVNVLEGASSTVTTGGRATIPGRTLIVDSNGTNAYAITASGISIIPLTPIAPSDRPVVNNNGTVNLATYQPSVAPGSLISIFGNNMAQSAAYTAKSLPTVLGGTCVTLNNQPLPLLLTSTGQINAQVPVGLAAGSYSLVVRSISKQASTVVPAVIRVAKYAPGVYVSPEGQAAVTFKDGRLVTKNSPATRDQDLVIFANGLGPTHGGAVSTGNPAPASPLAVTDPVSVYFGDPRLPQSAIIVQWSGLVPGFIGLYQINVRVPGAHNNGDALPITIKIGGVSSPTTGPAVPVIALH